MQNHSLVERSNRRPISSGMVVIPLFRYRGAAHNASTISAVAARTSNAIGLMPTAQV